MRHRRQVGDGQSPPTKTTMTIARPGGLIANGTQRSVRKVPMSPRWYPHAEGDPAHRQGQNSHRLLSIAIETMIATRSPRTISTVVSPNTDHDRTTDPSTQQWSLGGPGERKRCPLRYDPSRECEYWTGRNDNHPRTRGHRASVTRVGKWFERGGHTRHGPPGKSRRVVTATERPPQSQCCVCNGGW